MSIKYHSAHKKELEIPDGLDLYNDLNGSIAVSYDVTENDIPHYFLWSDVIYSEPAWPAGYDIFCKRANTASKEDGYERYLGSINNIIKETKRPAFIVAGRKMLGYFQPDFLLEDPIRLNGQDAWLCIWKEKERNFKSNIDVLEYLANNYDCVLDFCCGYGTTAKIFKDAGKNFICSDFNRKCVYYVAKKYMGYAGE